MTQLSRIIDLEAEFDTFVTGLIPSALREAGQRKTPGPPPSISADTIFEHVLKVLDQNLDSALIAKLPLKNP